MRNVQNQGGAICPRSGTLPINPSQRRRFLIVPNRGKKIPGLFAGNLWGSVVGALSQVAKIENYFTG
jgi:hypothetical protein